jgi:hypothetical protein
MLKHIVMMKLEDMEPTEKEFNQKRLVSMLEGLIEHIPAISKLEVGNNFSTRPTAMDLVLITEFKGEKELDEYRVHPKHQKVLEFIKEVVDEVKVVDYWD